MGRRSRAIDAGPPRDGPLASSASPPSGRRTRALPTLPASGSSGPPRPAPRGGGPPAGPRRPPWRTLVGPPRPQHAAMGRLRPPPHRAAAGHDAWEGPTIIGRSDQLSKRAGDNSERIRVSVVDNESNRTYDRSLSHWRLARRRFPPVRAATVRGTFGIPPRVAGRSLREQCPVAQAGGRRPPINTR